MELSLAPTSAAPATARAAVTTWLARHSRDAVLIEIALLLVSELVTNSVRHAGLAAGASLRLNASLDATTLRLELRDDGTGGTVERRTPKRSEDTGGYGLDLVERLSSGWGVDRDADGTTVWLELPIPFDEPA